MKYKALVSGGCGFVGSHLVEALVSLGWEVIVVDNLFTKKNHILDLVKFGKVKLYDISINQPALQDIFYQERPDYVFHLAAIPEVEYSIRNPQETYFVNLMGTVNVLELCKQFGVKKFVFSSSAAVYGDIKLPWGGLQEESTLKPLSPYGLQKKIAEEVILSYNKLYGLRYAILRYQNIYGPRQKETGSYAPVMSIFQRQINEREPLTVFGDGKQTRDFVYVKDVVMANLIAAISEKNGIANIGSGVGKKIIDIAKLYSKDIKFVENPRTGDIKHSFANIKKAWKLWGWKPLTSFEEGFKEIYYK